MASNPMQRKSRNSFLLGMLITLVITGVAIGFLFIALKNKTEELNAEINAKRNVYVLNQNVKSGQEITHDMFILKSVHFEAIPSNATSVFGDIDTWYLQTKEGEMLCTDKYGLYLDRSNGTADKIIEVMQDAEGDYYDNDGKIERLDDDNNKILDDNETGAFLVDEEGKDTKTRVYQEALTGEYYIYKLNDETMSTGGAKRRVKEYISINNVPVLAKVDMNANTIITPNLVVQSDEVVTDDVRQQEYNVISLPVDLMTDDYVDIRLMTPAGQDFIVISKARVDVPMNADGTYLADTIKMNLREDEILVMSSAIVEAAGLKGTKLYATKYVEPALQDEAHPTYTPNAAVTALIDTNGDNKIDNPNIVENAMKELQSRYSAASKKARNDYLQTLINLSEDYNGNVQNGIDESITNSSAARKKYLDSLGY